MLRWFNAVKSMLAHGRHNAGRYASRRRRAERSLEQLEARRLLAGDLIASWLADDLNADHGDQELVDRWTDSVGGIQARASGTPWLIHNAIGGRSVLRFDPSDGVDLFRVNLNESPMSGIDDFSVAVVFATSSSQLQGGNDEWFRNTGLVDANQIGFTNDWGLTINAEAQLSAGLGTGFGEPTRTLYSSSSGWNDGRFHLAVYTKNADTLSLYVDDGAPDTRMDANLETRADIDMTFGALQSSDNPLAGDIAAVRIYRGALDLGEIESLHQEITAYYTNVAPVATNDLYKVAEDELLAVTADGGLLINDLDDDGDDLTAVLIKDVTHGSLVLSPDGSFSYRPAPDFHGTDTFTYTANDFRTSNVATVTIEVEPRYDGVSTAGDQFVLLPGMELPADASRNVLANDINPDQVSLAAVLEEDVSDGQLTLLEDGRFEYDPQGFVGTTQFSYRVDDGTQLSEPAVVVLEVVSQPIRINEFQASNDKTLLDEDRESSDWIELFNPTFVTIPLAGWFLTDDARQLNKWQFPDGVQIEPNAYLIVFASGKNRVGQQLHTNFAIRRRGEYLALVAPDGQTVVSEFGPQGSRFPEQFDDISYGVNQSSIATSLVDANTVAHLEVPTDDQGAADWFQPTYNPTGWTEATASIGYDVLDSQDGLLAHWDFETDATAGGTVPDGAGGPISHEGQLVGDAHVDAGELVLDGTGDYLDLGDANDLEALSAMSIAVTVRSDVLINSMRRIVEHEDVFYLWAEANHYRFTIHGGAAQIVSEATVGRTEQVHLVAIADGQTARLYVDGNLEGTISIPPMPASDHPMQIGARRSGGGSASSFWDGTIGDVALWNRALTQDEIALLASGVSPTQLPAAGAPFQYDIQSEMQGVNSSLYLRIPFDLPVERDGIDQMTLEVESDDGLVAYLNGQEIARRNAPNQVTWNSHALAEGQDNLWEIDLTEFIPLLEDDTNLLAIQGLNVDASDSDFVLIPELSVSQIQAPDAGPRFFTTPTPGGPNGAGVAGMVTAEVAFSRAGHTFSEPFELVLSSTADAGTIRFTPDGSVPDESSTVYTEAIPVTSTVQIRARVFEPDKGPGPLHSESFVRLATDVVGFQSPLPILVIENFGAGRVPNKRAHNPPASDGGGIQQVERQFAQLQFFERKDGVSSLDGEPDLASRSGIRVRGSSSANFRKQSLSVETWGENNDDFDVEPLGLPSESDWVLYGPSPEFDRTLLHNSFIYELSRQIGRYAVRFQFVEVFLNTNGGSLSMRDHQGVYLWMEKIKRDSNRVDIEPLSIDGSTGGWMLQSNRMEPIPVGGSEHPPNFHTKGPNRRQQGPYGRTFTGGTDRGGDDIPTGYNTFLNFESPRAEEINSAQIESIVSWFDEFEDALYGPNFMDPETGYRAYIDVGSFIDHALLTNLALSFDALQLSTFMFRRSENDKLELGPIWDFDRAYGTDSRAVSPTQNLTYTQRFLWMPRLFQDPDFAQAYQDRWQQLRTGPFSTDNMHAIIDRQAAEITEEVAAANGTSRWPDKLQAMKNWLASRVRAKDRLYTPLPDFSSTGGTVISGHRLEISASQGEIHYTTDGTDPRARGGSISPSARLYDGPIEITQEVTIIARARDGADWSGPLEARFTMAGPGDANADGLFNSQDLVQVFQAGEYEDGIPGNSTWSEGDWNGDREFNTSDLVAAFQAGSYEAAAAVDRLFARPLL